MRLILSNHYLENVIVLLKPNFSIKILDFRLCHLKQKFYDYVPHSAPKSQLPSHQIYTWYFGILNITVLDDSSSWSSFEYLTRSVDVDSARWIIKLVELAVITVLVVLNNPGAEMICRYALCTLCR